jgi:hypothetical protein
MENQKIQQLIRLASIADKNGDYKIADKIFEKLAATPPMIKRFRDPSKLRLLLTPLLKLDQLNTLVKPDNIQELFDNMVISGLPPTVANFEAAFADYKLWTETTDPVAKAANKNAQIKYFEQNYESLKLLYDNLIKLGVNPDEVLTKDSLRAKLKSELDKVDFDPNALKDIPPLEKAVLERIKAEMQLTDAGAAQKARQKILNELTPKQINESTNKRFELLKTKINSTEAQSASYQSVVADVNAIKLNKQLTRQQKNELLFDLYKTSKSLGVELKKQEKKLTEGLNILQRTFTRKFSNSAQLSVKLKELLENYDKIFFYYFREELAIQVSARQKAITNYRPSPGSTKPKPFDINDDNDFRIVLEAAYNKCKDSNFSAQVRSLVETIESNLKTEIEVAKSNLTNKTPSGDDIYTDIMKRNPNLPKTLNFDKGSFVKIIDSLNNDGNLSIEQVMSITSNELPWFKTRLAPFLLNGLKNFAASSANILKWMAVGGVALSIAELTPLRPFSKIRDTAVVLKGRADTDREISKNIERAKQNEVGIFGQADPRK